MYCYNLPWCMTYMYLILSVNLFLVTSSLRPQIWYFSQTKPIEKAKWINIFLFCMKLTYISFTGKLVQSYADISKGTSLKRYEIHLDTIKGQKPTHTLHCCKWYVVFKVNKFLKFAHWSTRGLWLLISKGHHLTHLWTSHLRWYFNFHWISEILHKPQSSYKVLEARITNTTETSRRLMVNLLQ